MQLDINELFTPSNFILPLKNADIESNADDENQDRLYEFVVDLSNISEEVKDTKAVFIKGDRQSSILKASVAKNNKPFNLSGFTVTMNIIENSNEVETYACIVESIEDGIVLVELPPQYVDEEGICTFELSLQKGDKVILSQKYSYAVLSSIGEGNPGTEVQMTALQSLIQQVQEKIDIVDKKLNELKITSQDVDEIIGMIGEINVIE